jgi:pSer/pThr/pTyr-binding forkhead associated (FHA) protein/uncharacterized RDD family membrane protein YckC
VNEATWRYLLTVEGRPVELSDGEATFGRSRTSTVRLDHESVSRSHALLTLNKGEVTIRDLNSSNGTWIGGRRLAGEARLPEGGRVQLGAAVVEIRVAAPAVPSEKTALIDSSSQPPAAGPAPLREVPAASEEAPFRTAVSAPDARRMSASSLFSDIDQQARAAKDDDSFHEDVFSARLPLPSGETLPPAPPPPAAPPVPASAADVPLAIGGPALPPRGATREVPAPPRPSPGAGAIPVLGGLGARFVAILVDGVIVAAMNLILTSPVALILYFRPSLPSAPTGPDRVLLGISVLSLLLILAADLAYGAGLLAMKGRTPGKALLGLAVVKGEMRAGEGIGWSAALIRWIVQALGAAPLGFGWWVAAFRRDRRALHDLAAGTRVVRMR